MIVVEIEERTLKFRWDAQSLSLVGFLLGFEGHSFTGFFPLRLAFRWRFCLELVFTERILSKLFTVTLQLYEWRREKNGGVQICYSVSTCARPIRGGAVKLPSNQQSEMRSWLDQRVDVAADTSAHNGIRWSSDRVMLLLHLSSRAGYSWQDRLLP